MKYIVKASYGECSMEQICETMKEALEMLDIFWKWSRKTNTLKPAMYEGSIKPINITYKEN